MANEQTPLTVNIDPLVTAYDQSYPLWNAACLTAVVIVAAILTLILLVTAILPEKLLSASSAIGINAMDVLQWCILIVTFLLSVASLYTARANNRMIKHYSNKFALQTQCGHSDTKLEVQTIHDRPGAALRATQQQAMLSLAILVCNYADLFVMVNQYLRRYKQINQYAFLFSALKATSVQMLDGLNRIFATGLTREITNSQPDAKEQFTLYMAHLLDAANHDKLDKWGKRGIIEGNERLLIQIMSYLTNNNQCIGGEAAVNPVLDRIDGLLNVHLHLLEQHQL
eukprot:CAMPEP_0172316644 /NCGR_PEP_ID=MMETSP1058-20130122/28963_1 /TAXON_ID=83371 /ORGANISM="Detonula confervacea, Strain CCMP 353" /LENGTH=283 /DNA_ID=CAMNT_0013030997 /DNA_START=131 /DNA_END=982 /DNA_ORIENTATION=-